jgi:hypothetical protein
MGLEWYNFAMGPPSYCPVLDEVLPPFSSLHDDFQDRWLIQDSTILLGSTCLDESVMRSGMDGWVSDERSGMDGWVKDEVRDG